MIDLFGNEKIRTLGLYQPFATLMLYGKIETRWVNYPKKAPFPLGKYLIYSTQRCYDFFEAEQMMGEEVDLAHRHFKTEINYGKGTINPETKDFILGHAICLGDLVHILDPITPDIHHTFVEYMAPCTRRRVGLAFENMQRIEPFKFKGKQGVGILTEEQKKLIKISA